MSAQQALAAKCVASIANILGNKRVEQDFAIKHRALDSLINKHCWDETSHFYYDTREDGTLSSTKHVGAYWTFVSDVIKTDRISPMLEHLLNPKEFWRPHLVPTLSADDPHYDSSGHYWLGSVWAPTNYMVIKGLEAIGRRDLADSVAFNHVKHVSNIFRFFTPNEDSVAFEERYADGYKTIWECYSPEFSKPATRWDNTFYSRQDFVGWSGLGPIAMLIENVLGFEVRGYENTIVWRVKRTDRHGIEHMQLRSQFVSVVATPRNDTLAINVRCQNPFALDVEWRGEMRRFKTRKGDNVFHISK